MSDKPSFSLPVEMMADQPDEDVTQKSNQQNSQKPTQQVKQTSEWGFKQEAKEWGREFKSAVGATPTLDPQQEMKRQMDEQKKIANIKQFFTQLEAQQKAVLDQQKFKKQQEEQVKKEEAEQKKQAESVKKGQKKQATQEQTLYNAKRRTEIKKVGG